MKRSAGLLAFSILALATRAHADVRKVDAFTAIDLQGLMAAEVRVGSAISVDVQGEADLAKLVSTTVKGGTLVIDTPDDFKKHLKGRNDNKLKVVITMPALARVTISGTGAIEVDGLAQKTLDASISGTGSLKLKGRADTLKLGIQGTGEVRAKDLVASAVDVTVQGTAEAVVHATKSFEANVMGTAMVKVHGKPASVKKNVAGTAMIDVK
jgi:hypothetical protein